MWIAPRSWVTSGRRRRVEGWKSRRPANSPQCLARSIQPHWRSLSPRASQHARGAALLGAALGVAVRRLQPAQSRRRNVALVTPIPQCDRAWRGCDGRCCDGRQSGRFSWSWSGRRRRRTSRPACAHQRAPRCCRSRAPIIRPVAAQIVRRWASVPARHVDQYRRSPSDEQSRPRCEHLSVPCAGGPCLCACASACVP